MYFRGTPDTFTIERGNSDGLGFVEIAVVGGTINKYEDREIVGGTRYTYRLKIRFGNRASRYTPFVAVKASGTKPTGSVMDTIRAQQAAAAKSAAAEAEENRRNGLREYVEILLRIERPKNGDAEVLTELMSDRHWA